VSLFYAKDSGVWDIFHISDDLPYVGHINAKFASENGQVRFGCEFAGYSAGFGGCLCGGGALRIFAASQKSLAF
jgi:hypothetical protein